MILNTEWPILFLCGAAGAIIKDILKDNKISLPFIKGKDIYLGCIGGIIIGGFAGYFVDNDPVTAFLGGYAGSQIIQGLVISTIKTKAERDKQLDI